MTIAILIIITSLHISATFHPDITIFPSDKRKGKGHTGTSVAILTNVCVYLFVLFPVRCHFGRNFSSPSQAPHKCEFSQEGILSWQLLPMSLRSSCVLVFLRCMYCDTSVTVLLTLPFLYKNSAWICFKESFFVLSVSVVVTPLQIII